MTATFEVEQVQIGDVTIKAREPQVEIWDGYEGISIKKEELPGIIAALQRCLEDMT